MSDYQMEKESSSNVSSSNVSSSSESLINTVINSNSSPSSKEKTKKSLPYPSSKKKKKKLVKKIEETSLVTSAVSSLSLSSSSSVPSSSSSVPSSSSSVPSSSSTSEQNELYRKKQIENNLGNSNVDDLMNIIRNMEKEFNEQKNLCAMSDRKNEEMLTEIAINLSLPQPTIYNTSKKGKGFVDPELNKSFLAGCQYLISYHASKLETKIKNKKKKLTSLAEEKEKLTTKITKIAKQIDGWSFALTKGNEISMNQEEIDEQLRLLKLQQKRAELYFKREKNSISNQKNRVKSCLFDLVLGKRKKSGKGKKAKKVKKIENFIDLEAEEDDEDDEDNDNDREENRKELFDEMDEDSESSTEKQEKKKKKKKKKKTKRINSDED